LALFFGVAANASVPLRLALLRARRVDARDACVDDDDDGGDGTADVGSAADARLRE
jgi:hypothetical protein